MSMQSLVKKCVTQAGRIGNLGKRRKGKNMAKKKSGKLMRDPKSCWWGQKLYAVISSVRIVIDLKNSHETSPD